MPSPPVSPPPDLPFPALAVPALPLRLNLNFSPDSVERRFGEHYLAFYHRYAQAALLLGLLLVIGDFLVDWLAQPDLAANWLRLQVAVPILLVGLAYTLLPQARRHWQPVLGGFIVAVAMCLFWVLKRLDAEGGQGLTSWVGILNFTFLQFYCFIVLGVQFRIALIAGLAMLGLFEATLWTHAHQMAAQAAYWSYHVVTLFILAAGIGWWREFIVRKDFAAQSALEDAREAAVQLARAKSTFLATMSHEIRTPLNGVLGMNELLLDSGLTAEQREWAEGVRVSGRHLLSLINDVLDVSKIEAGRLTLEAVDFKLADVIEEARLMFAQPAQAKGLALLAIVAPADAVQTAQPLRGDPLRLRQVIANLIGNAVKFTAHGSVAVHAGWVLDGDGQARVRIAVQDTGIGISEEARERIFDKFAQADSSTTRRYGGTGLGLSICRELVALMDGSIAVASTPGQGSCFTVDLRLPLGSATAAVGVAQGAPRHMSGTVLLVEDHPVNRSVAIGMLRKLGLSWQVAENGADAVAQVRQQPFDAVLMDCQMPVMDGYRATAAIRALPEGRGATLPIVALTANATAEDARRCREAGMDGFVAKPFTLASLAAALEPWLATADASSPRSPARAPRPEMSPATAGAAIDRAAVATLLDLDDSGELLREVVTGFLQTADAGLAEVRAALVAGSTQGLSRPAHALKSSAANVGARVLSALYGDIERRAHAGRMGDVGVQLEAIDREQARATAELGALLLEFA
jgi:signal transduction histidine kinase/CheY-like chemotaxis protein/HPt (histidine-containing phosphotransfer) domain-containing protein